MSEKRLFFHPRENKNKITCAVIISLKKTREEEEEEEEAVLFFMRARARVSLSLSFRRVSSRVFFRSDEDETTDGERDSFLLSWDVIAKCDDIFVSRICFAEIEFERCVKFLHGVNTETRKLIKRSSVVG